MKSSQDPVNEDRVYGQETYLAIVKALQFKNLLNASTSHEL